MSWPATVTVPVVAVTMPQTMLISVVLPAPLGPSRAKISPLWISRSTFRRACRPEAYVLVRSRIERIGCMGGRIREGDRLSGFARGRRNPFATKGASEGLRSVQVPGHHFSATALRAARPASKSAPIILSMLKKTVITLETKGIAPSMAHVVVVESPCGTIE